MTEQEQEQELTSLLTIPNMISIPGVDYSVSETPITVGQFLLFCASNTIQPPKQPEPYSLNNPVVNVSYYDAEKYCIWLTQQNVATPHHNNSSHLEYSLPANDQFEFFCADHTEATPEIAVYGRTEICKVATKQPNKYNLYDYLGCVWEWQLKEKAYAVVRGGSWRTHLREYAHCVRDRYFPDFRHDDVGFRVVRRVVVPLSDVVSSAKH